MEEHYEANAVSDDDCSSYGEAEEAQVACYSEDEGDVIDVFAAGADVEDLGKRKGTNPARDELVKKLRDTPPNANTSFGGYRAVPVQPMRDHPMRDYKTYKIKKDSLATVKKDGKEAMRKPVAVPLNQYMGLSLLATKNKDKLVQRLTKEAASAIDSYVEADVIEVCEPQEVLPAPRGRSPVLEARLATGEEVPPLGNSTRVGEALPVVSEKSTVHEALLVTAKEVQPSSTIEVAPLEINNVAAAANQVSQTLYVPVLFPNCQEPQWALVDTGAQLSLITTTCARFCNLVSEGFENVVASDLKVGGVNGQPWQTARLKTTVILGNQRLATREMPVEFALLGGDRYKIIIGMDILKEHKMVVDLAQETLRFKLPSEDKVNLKLVPRGTIFKTK